MGLILERGRIVTHIFDGGLDIRVPQKYTNVPEERLRYLSNGKWVDLASLDSIWVAYRNGAWELYGEPYPDAQLVKMRFEDKRKLIDDGGLYRVLTDNELNQLRLTQKIKKDAAIARKKIKRKTQDHPFELLVMQLLALLVLYSSDPANESYKQSIDSIANDIESAYLDDTDLVSDLRNFAVDISRVVNKFCEEKKTTLVTAKS